uniref:Kazal-like domain-containing protein n=1 Tax=Anopheles gambiae TaxID=7165 RepID=A0A2Y9D299_ANOGA
MMRVHLLACIGAARGSCSADHCSTIRLYFKRDSPCICQLYKWPVYRSDNHIYGNNCDLECTRNTPEGRLIGLHQVSMDKCNAES